VLLTQIFLNYDCDFDAMNLYKEIVHNLTKLSGKSTIAPSNNLSKKEQEQDAELNLAGVEVLVTILKAFLKALGLPGGEEDGADDGARIRNLLQIDISDVPSLLPFDDIGAISPSSANGPEDALNESNSSHDTKAPSSAAADLLKAENNSNAADKIVDAFEMKRNAQQSFELGVVKFTLSLKSGLKFFIDNGFVQADAHEVALFFLEHKDKLDKTQIGEALGREPDAPLAKDDTADPEKGGPGFWVRVLHHYTNAMDFTGMVFDDAIRLFLSGFRLPGEAQKIDRIMEKFAEHYTRQNVDVFPSADTAFILAFSVIMLNTDLHNPSIKPEKRMTLDSFIRNNSGIAENGGDLPIEVVTGIFNRIQARPFTLKEDDAAREKAKKEMMESTLFFDSSSFFGASAEDQKREKFKKEREEMMAATEQLIRKRPGKNVKTASNILTDTVSPADVVKPMFDVTWGPIIGTLSQVLESSADDRIIATCLNGFVYAVRIACYCGMSLARDTFVNSLAKFTFLGSIKEMKRKNVDSICTLLTIAIVDGEYLGGCWLPVLQCLSQLARLRLAGSGLDTDESFLVDNDKRKKLNRALSSRSESSNDAVNVFRPPFKPEPSRETEENNGRAVFAAVNEVLIDKVFSSTVKLSAQTLALFIEQLVAVSASEIAGNTKSGITGVGPQGMKSSTSKGEEGPSIFSLQRLVEVADFNMDVRPRLVWSKVWQIMADHFASIGRHENPMVSVFAIDSLKQLTFKFLDKPELSDFNFQRIFLRPFLQIIEDERTREDIRELVLRCVDNAVRTKSHNLQSGWKIFFSILTRSACDPSERINTLGLAILQRLLDDHLHQLCRLSSGDGKEDGLSESNRGEEVTAIDRRSRNANVEDFLALCRASLAFVQRNNSNSTLPIGLSMRALCHTCIYADLLGDHRVLPPVSGAQVSFQRP
jgi:brefeldin A-inhibited guanine nucleotide-exchange protein